MGLLRVIVIVISVSGALTSLSVRTPPEITVAVGSDLDIPCQWSVARADGKSPSSVGGVILQWFIETDKGERRRVFYRKDAVKLLEKLEGYSREMSVADDFTMLLRNATRRDARSYICQVTAAAGGTEDSTTRVTVRDVVAPEIELPKESVIMTQGNHAVVGTCVARNAFPQPNITWHRGNEPVVTSADFILEETVTKDADDLYTVRSKMLFRQRSFANSTFHCRVRQGAPGRHGVVVASGEITVVHEGKPEFKKKVVYVWVPDVNTQNSLVCEATANPRPNIIWNITGSTVEQWSAETNVLSSRLALNLNSLERVTVVSCSAWNSRGWGEMTFVVNRREDTFPMPVVIGISVIFGVLLLLIVLTSVIINCRRKSQKHGAAKMPLNGLHHV